MEHVQQSTDKGETMKKYIYAALILGVFASNEALAERCANGAGKVITSNMGTRYCLGDSVRMNWWSAFSWCESAGYTLADVTKDCVCTDDVCKYEFTSSDLSNELCLNFTGLGRLANNSVVFRNLSYGSTIGEGAASMYFTSCSIGTCAVLSTYYKTSNYHPLCRM